MPAQPVAIGVPLGKEATANAQATGEADLGKGIIQRVTNDASGAQDRMMFYRNMSNDLNNFKAGQGSDWTLKAKQIAQYVAPGVAGKLGVNPDTISSQEGFNKYAAQIANAGAASMGEGTDQKLASAAAANPNAKLTNLTNSQLLNVLSGIESQKLAKQQVLQNSPLANARGEEANFNRNVDPRTFMVSSMTPQQFSSWQKTLSSNDKQKLQASYQYLTSKGVNVFGGQ